MEYYTSFCPRTPDVCSKIIDYIASLELPVVCQIQHNRHELADYKSVEVYWTHGEEYSDFEYQEEDLTEEQEARREALDEELNKLNGMERLVANKFESDL